MLEVTWPRIIQFYHPSSSHCTHFQTSYVAIARGLKRRSSRLPVEFHAVNCGVYREVCELGFSVKSVPTLMILKSGSIRATEIALPDDTLDDAEKVRYIADALGVSMDAATGKAGGAFARDFIGGANVHEDFVDNSSNAMSSMSISEQVFHDATSSFLITLTSSLYAQFPHGSSLPPDTSRSLREFIDLIRWAYPPETKVHALAEELLQEFFSISTSEEGLLVVVGRHMNLGEGATWSPRCNVNGDDGSRGGYSCGILSLLHILSLGVAERHTSVVGDVDRVSVQHAGQVMRAFVDKFFIGCSSCSKTFTELYEEACCSAHNKNVELGVADNWKHLAFWIWSVHNTITAHRQYSAGKGYYNKYSRMASSNTLWPSRGDCSQCWLKADGDGRVTNMDSYDRDALYSHLKQTYWLSGAHNNRLIVLDRWTKAKRALSIQHLRVRMTSHWTFSEFIINMTLLSVVLYVSFTFSTQWRVFSRRMLVAAGCDVQIFDRAPVKRRKQREQLSHDHDDMPRNQDCRYVPHRSSSINLPRSRQTNRRGVSSLRDCRRHVGAGQRTTNNNLHLHL